MAAARLFVYGTLMRGEANHAWLAAGRYLGAAATAPAFSLYDLGAYPALVLRGACSVVGELYEVGPEVLAALDRFEGVPHLYVRRRLALRDGPTAEGYALASARALAGAVLIPGGDWRARAGG